MSGKEEHQGIAGILVVGTSRLLDRPSVCACLDSATVPRLAIPAFNEAAIDGIHRALADRDVQWSIALHDAAGGNSFFNFVPALIAAGMDDAIDSSRENFEQILSGALESATTLIELINKVESTNFFVGTSIASKRIRKTAALAIQAHESPVLILGETGTGKGQVARAIHAADASRSDSPFHVLDCGSITDTLFGSELFGHVRGAFTGAQQNRKGAFESASRGTLLIDEIGELQPATQGYLLTALQDLVYRPVGSDRGLPIDCRILSATNRSLDKVIDGQEFRSDLYHRLDGIRISVPPLRDRSSDIPELLEHIINKDGARNAIEVDADVIEYLQDYHYPGNVRELASIAAQMRSRAGPERHIRFAHIPFNRLASDSSGSTDAASSVKQMVLNGSRMRDIENEFTRQAAQIAIRIWRKKMPDLQRTEVVKLVAESLGVSPRTIYNKLNGEDRRH
ncbi:MAG: sigma 54-interacting transcriptional regulator [Gammaproteobacteria bacterium]|nr:sigma 54-interacting transcriptional regulator [Gammaproteobacteria bacterium]